MWLFDFSKLKINTENSTLSKQNLLTIVIQKVTNINNLLKTLDSIKNISQDDGISLILVNDTKDDLEEILQFYKTIFKKIIIVNNKKFGDLEIELSKVNCRYLFTIDSGMTLSEKFFKKIATYIDSHNFSILYFPIINNNKNKRYVFYQLFISFWQACKCSLVNRNLYSINNIDIVGVLIKKKFFIDFLDHLSQDKIDQKFIIDSDLLIYENDTKVNIDIHYSLVMYIALSLFYFTTLTEFITSQSLLYLLVISIKVLPELYYIYAYYNRLKIKFPKVEFLAYSFFSPLYLLMILLSNMKLDGINNKE